MRGYEIFAYGLRHAWRAGFDRQTGDLYLGDAGSNHFEEINLVPAAGPSGLNFGWRAREGDSDTPQFPDPAPMNAVNPLYFYPNDPGSSAVTGGLVYRGTKMPGLQGHYFFADFVKGTMATFNTAGGTVSDFVDRTSEIGGISGVVAFFEDAAGELYYMRRSTTNSLYKLVGYLRGDFTRDGFVDEFDLAKWQGDFAHNGDADADGDGDSDGKDFLIWQRQFGASTILSTSTAIPEPASLLLLTVVMLGLTARRSKKAFLATLK